MLLFIFFMLTHSLTRTYVWDTWWNNKNLHHNGFFSFTLLLTVCTVELSNDFKALSLSINDDERWTERIFSSSSFFELPSLFLSLHLAAAASLHPSQWVSFFHRREEAREIRRLGSKTVEIDHPFFAFTISIFKNAPFQRPVIKKMGWMWEKNVQSILVLCP